MLISSSFLLFILRMIFFSKRFAKHIIKCAHAQLYLSEYMPSELHGCDFNLLR